MIVWMTGGQDSLTTYAFSLLMGKGHQVLLYSTHTNRFANNKNAAGKSSAQHR